MGYPPPAALAPAPGPAAGPAAAPPPPPSPLGASLSHLGSVPMGVASQSMQLQPSAQGSVQEVRHKREGRDDTRLPHLLPCPAVRPRRRRRYRWPHRTASCRATETSGCRRNRAAGTWRRRQSWWRQRRRQPPSTCTHPCGSATAGPSPGLLVRGCLCAGACARVCLWVGACVCKRARPPARPEAAFSPAPTLRPALRTAALQASASCRAYSCAPSMSATSTPRTRSLSWLHHQCSSPPWPWWHAECVCSARPGPAT